VLDLTASRRLALAAEQSGATLFLLRLGAEPAPSAADTRWAVSAAPSEALEANAPGAPTFDIELLRRRSGPSGMRWRLEWNRDRLAFIDPALPGAVVSLSTGRPAAAQPGLRLSA
jgi:protein ImuA